MASTRRAGARDIPFMIHVLRLAAGGANGPLSIEECRSNPAISHYLDRWSPEQLGLICSEENTEIGAAWLTLLPADDPGYGFIAPTIPELTIGVAPEYQGKGHGDFLLSNLLDAADRAGVRSISLSVADDNDRARAMYQRAGFSPVGQHQQATTMLRVA
ncbi:GNAT family N-acetyltransferase [Acidipropionibacterium jensenii]|uniref:GNAT family N-acetyltransferase n=1 Tax=Acidipropionibacterium jensenii TaxID=1749 RepID=UPI00110A1A13|nr:GNAT family N-acetyltransferase [Acidipropionibacterium jensenii]QCV87171.1 GNAT family N-acetyltransferase [Acidipropionibacterium jensenii]